PLSSRRASPARPFDARKRGRTALNNRQIVSLSFVPQHRSEQGIPAPSSRLGRIGSREASRTAPKRPMRDPAGGHRGFERSAGEVARSFSPLLRSAESGSIRAVGKFDPRAAADLAG